MTIRSGDWKLVRYDRTADGVEKSVSEPKLYNLAEDIHEDHDLSAAMPERVKEMQAKWDEWNQRNIPPGAKDDGRDNDGAEPGTPARRKREVAARR
jgi:arylsulfatase A-like enzyme